jgi:hypothetical protein
MRVITYENDNILPQIGDLVSYYNFYTNQQEKGIIVDIYINEYEDEVYDDNDKLEDVLIEYLVYTIVGPSGLDCHDINNINIIPTKY